jgi:hypothetical protein
MNTFIKYLEANDSNKPTLRSSGKACVKNATDIATACNKRNYFINAILKKLWLECGNQEETSTAVEGKGQMSWVTSP